MRKYQILVLTNNPTHAHGAVLKNTFGKRPYTGVTSTVNELILKYDDAEITIKRYVGGSLDSMRGYRWDEVWVDNHAISGTSDEEKFSLIDNVYFNTRRYSEEALIKEFPHYAHRKAVSYFDKSDDGHGN